MNLLRVIATVDPRAGGPVEGMRRANHILAESGTGVEVVCTDAPENARKHAGDEPWPTHGLGPPKFGTYAYARKLRPWLDANLPRFDAAIVHGNWQYHGLAASRACRRAGVPYLVYPHGMLDPWFNRAYPLKKWKKRLYWWWGEHPVLRHAAAVLFTCEEERRLARQSFRPYRVRERVIGYGTRPPEVGERSANTASPAGERPYLLFLGRIQEKKGLDLLLGAYAAFRREAPDPPDLVLAGPEQQPAFARRLRDGFPGEGVIWAGTLEGPAKWRALAEAEALVLPSHQENFGLAVAEALATGTPVLISDKVNIWREIREGGAGLVEPDTASGTETLLRRWSALSAGERRAMSDAALRVFAEHFDLRRATQRLVALVRETVTARENA